MNQLLVSTALTLVFIFLTFREKIIKRYKILYIFLILYFFIDQIINRVMINIRLLSFISSKYNWDGKILSLVLSVIFIIFIGKKFNVKFGLNLKINEKSKKFVSINIILIFIIIFIIFLKDFNINFYLENIYFLTIVGFSEELSSRGIQLSLLDKMFMNKRDVLGINFSIIITSFIFALSHLFYVNNDIFQITLLGFFISLIFGFYLGYLRKISGNLLICILFHNLLNIILINV